MYSSDGRYFFLKNGCFLNLKKPSPQNGENTQGTKQTESNKCPFGPTVVKVQLFGVGGELLSVLLFATGEERGGTLGTGRNWQRTEVSHIHCFQAVLRSRFASLQFLETLNRILETH